MDIKYGVEESSSLEGLISWHSSKTILTSLDNSTEEFPKTTSSTTKVGSLYSSLVSFSDLFGLVVLSSSFYILDDYDVIACNDILEIKSRSQTILASEITIQI